MKVEIELSEESTKIFETLLSMMKKAKMASEKTSIKDVIQWYMNALFPKIFSEFTFAKKLGLSIDIEKMGEETAKYTREALGEEGE